MKQSLQLRLGQHLAMTPQLQQAIRLLQLSTLELQMEVQQALDSNLMLETDEEYDNPVNGSGEVDVKPADIPIELAVDSRWEDTYDSGSYTYNGSDGPQFDFEAQRSAVETLSEHLQWQVDMTNFSDLDRAIATSIIDSLGDDGYLTVPLAEIQQSIARNGIEVNPQEMDAVLHRLQNFDPPGVAARDLRECLFIQLRQFGEGQPWAEAAMRIVNDYLDLLASRDFPQLMRRLSLDRDQLDQVVALIQSLNPRPGTQISAPPPQYIIPDVFVRKHKGVWIVELNPEASPKVRINSQYASLIKRADNSADNNCLKSHLQEARWFLKSLQSRSETLLKVTSCIVERQQQFLEYGDEAMKPMVLHDVAEVVDMHESTISRVTTQKYMHSPRGIFELKYFFSSHVALAGGGEASSTAIRAVLKKLIEAENPRKPLSDNKLAGILSEQGINVARRTVAKYREALTIPSSSERKRHA